MRKLSFKKVPAMRSARLILAGFVTSIALLVSLALANAVDSVPNLAGVWSGKVESGVSHGIQGHEPKVDKPTFGNYKLTFTLAIKEQEGRAFVGSWSSSDHSERIFGVIRRNNTNLILVDEDSYFDGLLLSPTSMELCLAETHHLAMGVWCLLLNKQVE